MSTPATSSTPDLARRLRAALVVSGFAGLVYETCWTRQLALAFGATSAALATVVAAFLGGLALGAALGGRLAERVATRRALGLYAAFELGVAALALASSLALARFPAVYAALEHAAGGARWPRYLAAGVLLLPPTMLMGATLPLLARAWVGSGAPLASGVARLYAWNTAGATLGALSTGLVLVPWLGISRSVQVGALASAAAAALVRRLARTEPGTARAAPAAAELAPPPLARLGRAALLASAALSGGAALGLEVLWSRTLQLVVGSTTQAIALTLGVFLGGIALGSWAYARGCARLRSHAAAAAGLQAGVAASALLGLYLAGALPFGYLALWDELHASRAGLFALRLVPALALVLGPTVLMGASLPALTRAFARERVGADVGAVYAANTLGSIAGVLAVGLFALPALGVTLCATWIGGASLLGALAALSAALGAREPGARRLAPPCALAALALALRPEWDPRVMARGVAYQAGQLAELRERGVLERVLEDVRVLHYGDGAESSVLVYDTGEGTGRAFVVNGRTEATSLTHDRRNQLLLAHLPALLHRGPLRNGLVIALGSGMTAGCLALHAERVTVVELEPEVLRAAIHFAPWNHDVLRDPRVAVVIDDGRHYLRATEERFDVITVDPIHPSVSGSETLYSLEHYRLVRSRLAPDGIAAQWLPLYQMGLEDARTIVATMLEVFPDAQIWLNGKDAILIGGAGASLRPAHELRAELARPPIAASLAEVGLERLGTFLAGFAAGPPDVAEFAAGARLSRDDRPVLEFSLAWQTYGQTLDQNVLEIMRFGRRAPAIALDGLEPGERDEIERANSAVALSKLAMALRLVRHEDAMRELFERALALDPNEVFARIALAR